MIEELYSYRETYSSDDTGHKHQLFVIADASKKIKLSLLPENNVLIISVIVIKIDTCLKWNRICSRTGRPN